MTETKIGTAELSGANSNKVGVAHGFALYVGISEDDAAAQGLTLTELVVALRAKLNELVPGAHESTYAAAALAPRQQPGKNLDVVRIALGEPKAVAQLNSPGQRQLPQPEQNQPGYGIVVDLTRKRIFLDGRKVVPTCKEFALLAHLIANQGRNVSRDEIWRALGACPEAESTSRAVDVYVRRLRAKLPGYEDIVTTVRGVGYRFDSNPEVLVEQL
ncbi:MAG: hypothetical protein RL198_497 [Actinomycetota bacterium]